MVMIIMIQIIEAIGVSEPPEELDQKPIIFL
jgi:hypothetical protein